MTNDKTNLKEFSIESYPTRNERLDALPGYTFKVASDFSKPFEIKQGEDGKYGIITSPQIDIVGYEIFCTESSYNTLKNNESEFTKFKDFLDANKPVIVYTKGLSDRLEICK